MFWLCFVLDFSPALLSVNGFSGVDIEFECGTKGKFLQVDDVIAILEA